MLLHIGSVNEVIIVSLDEFISLQRVVEDEQGEVITLSSSGLVDPNVPYELVFGVEVLAKMRLGPELGNSMDFDDVLVFVVELVLFSLQFHFSDFALQLRAFA